MEVKVWMDGIQRVVCGVTDQTTCRDIMVAIAHATGKTGRYTMIEKWMENERNLCGTDIPLRILHKYGEYASDIQFILRHSSLPLPVANCRTKRLCIVSDDTRSRGRRVVRLKNR